MVEIPGQNIQVGPFIGGLNTFSDDTSVADNELPVCENFELDLDGSLKSRPTFRDLGVAMPLGATGNITLLGYYYAPDGTPSLLASDGLTSTYRFDGTSWALITSTFAATAMAQFDGKAYMTAPLSSANPGGYWTPSGGFVAEPNMPKGDIIVSHKFRLWVAPGKNAATNGTRLYRSDVLGTTPLWPASPAFIDVGAGDGQSIVQVLVNYNTLLIFRTRSIYNFQFTADPAQGVVSLIVPGIGLSDRLAVVQFEAYVYFMYEDRAYEFVNNRATQINVKVPFKAVSEAGIYAPFVASEFNRRIIFSYYDTMFVFGLKTRTWTVWRSPQRGAIGKIIAQESGSSTPQAIAHSSASVGPTEPRSAVTLFLEDDNLTGEQFTCTLQTKNFNYQASSNYKRLFWWGVDALFRGTVTGTVSPVVYGFDVNWGQLRTGGKTWGSLLAFSWGQPQQGTLSIVQEQTTVGTTLGRKFIKFPKSLRFRQAYFTLEFPTDGAQVRVFSLSTFVLPKERVSSTIT